MNKSENTGPSILASFKMIIKEWFLSSTAHALPNIFRTGNILLKLIWLCCFLASGSYCVISVLRTLNDYFTYPSYISTKITQEIPTQFPAITICNLKSVNQTRSPTYLAKNIPKYSLINYISPFYYIISQQYLSRTFINNDPNLTNTTRKELGFELKDMLLSCSFNYLPCFVSDFTYYYDSTYGNCYTFNKGVDDNGNKNEIKKVSSAGLLYGLVLEIFVGDPKVDTYLESSDGVIISVHNQTSIPFTQGDKMRAATGAETDLIISRNFISKLETPYGDCLKDTSKTSKFTSFYFDYLVKTVGVSYSQENCFALCLQKQIINACNCSNTYLPSFNDFKHFCVDQVIESPCALDAVASFSKTNASEECKKSCPYECDSVEYSMSTYRTYYPSDYYASVLSDFLKLKGLNISSENVGRAVARVNIYYKSMQYLSTQQIISATTEDLFSNIGGTLGLYIGISILSVVEVFELGFNLILILFTSMKNKIMDNNNST
jgi:hypothetical protein